MAKQVKLSASARSQIGGTVTNKMKKEGLTPAVIYGGKEPPLPLQVGTREISTLLSRARGENILVELEIENAGARSSRMALIQEVQHEPLSGRIVHVDFHAINMNETLHTSVPIESFGESIGVRSFGGILEQLLRSVDIACLPTDLPEVISVNVSGLNIGDSIHVRHLMLPAGVKAMDDENLTVFLVAAPAVVEVEVPVAAAAPAQPEVIKEKKDETAAPAAPEKK
jgi:large subunit ribosomal protein L25